MLLDQEPISTFLGGPILLSSCFCHNICVRRWMCPSKVAALCYGHRDAQCGQGNVCDGVSFTPDAQTRGQGLVEAELPYMKLTGIVVSLQVCKLQILVLLKVIRTES